MRRIGSEIWIEFSVFVGIGVPERTLRDGVYSGSPRWQAIPDPSDKRKRLIRFATLADKYKNLIRTQLCGGLEPDEWLSMKEYEAEHVERLKVKESLGFRLETACEDGYKRYSYLYPGQEGRTLRYLCRAAGVLDVTVKWYQGEGIEWKNYGPVKEVSAWMVNNPDYFGKKYLPTNPLRLMEKVRAVGVKGKALNEVVYLPREGNTNRSGGDADLWWQAVAIQLRISGANYSGRAIHRKLVQLAALELRECPSESTVGNFLRANEVITVSKHTDLNNKKRQRHRPSMPVLRPVNSDACWEMDGTRVQLMPHATGQKTKGGNKELKSLYIVAVRDVYSGAFLGYWYGYSESEHAYRSALKMAVDITGRLPYELRYDRFPGHNTPGWEYMAEMLEKHGVTLSKTSASTGKASTERAFGVLQQVFESDRAGWIGQGVKASVAHARPTEQYINRQFKQLAASGWDFDRAWMEHADVIAEYNHTPYSVYSRKHANLNLSPWELYSQAEQDSEGRQIDVLERAELFWNARNEGIRNGKIEFTDRGQKHTYVIPVENYELIRDYQKPNVQVVVRHEVTDFSEIMVFDKSGNFLAELKETTPIQLYGKHANWGAAASYKANQKAIDARIAADLKQYDLPDEMAAVLPTLTTKKQHNDAQKEYAFETAGEWEKAPKKKEKALPVVKDVSLSDADIAALMRSQM